MRPPLLFGQNWASFYGQMLEPVLTVDEAKSCWPMSPSSLEMESCYYYQSRVAMDEPATNQ